MKIKEILCCSVMNYLKEGERVDLETKTNQLGEEVPIKYVERDGDSYVYFELLCHNSAYYDFGICYCNTHPESKKIKMNELETEAFIKNEIHHLIKNAQSDLGIADLLPQIFQT